MSIRVLVVQGGLKAGQISGEKTVIDTDSENFSGAIVSEILYLKCSLFGTLWSFNNYHHLCNAIDKFRPDIVHFHTVIPYLSLSVLQVAKKKNVKVEAQGFCSGQREAFCH